VGASWAGSILFYCILLGFYSLKHRHVPTYGRLGAFLWLLFLCFNFNAYKWNAGDYWSFVHGLLLKTKHIRFFFFLPCVDHNK